MPCQSHHICLFTSQPLTLQCHNFSLNHFLFLLSIVQFFTTAYAVNFLNVINFTPWPDLWPLTLLSFFFLFYLLIICFCCCFVLPIVRFFFCLLHLNMYFSNKVVSQLFSHHFETFANHSKTQRAIRSESNRIIFVDTQARFFHKIFHDWSFFFVSNYQLLLFNCLRLYYFLI